MQNACHISYPMVLYFMGNENMGRFKKKKGNFQHILKPNETLIGIQ